MAETFASLCAIALVLSVVDGKPTTTSLDIARHFSRPHDEVLRRIRNLLAQLPDDYCLRNFAEIEHERPSPLNGAPIKSPAYRITRDGFTLLAMGFTGKRALQFKLAYIDAFNKMEAELTASARQPALVITQKPTETQVASAMGMGNAIAGHVQQSVAMAVLRGGDDWKRQRWLVSFVTDSKHGSPPVVELLPPDAEIMTQRSLMKIWADVSATVWTNALGDKRPKRP